MIIVDNCILSSLAKIGYLDLLENFSDLRTSGGVIEEIFRSQIDEMVEPISAILGSYLRTIVTMEHKRVHDLQKQNQKLSYVDCELIILCQENHAVLFSDDTRLIDIAEKEYHIRSYDLCDILVGLKKQDRINKDDISEIILLLEKKDHYKVSDHSRKRLNI